MSVDATDADGKRRIIRFTPEVSMGTLIQMALFATACIGAYGAYTADKTAQHMEVAQIKADAEMQRTSTKESLIDLKVDVKGIQATLGEVKESLAVLKARPDPTAQKGQQR